MKTHPVTLIAPNGKEQPVNMSMDRDGVKLSTKKKVLNLFPFSVIKKWLPSMTRAKNPGGNDCLDIQLETEQGVRELRMRCQNEEAVMEVITDLRSTVKEIMDSKEVKSVLQPASQNSNQAPIEAEDEKKGLACKAPHDDFTPQTKEEDSCHNSCNSLDSHAIEEATATQGTCNTGAPDAPEQSADISQAVSSCSKETVPVEESALACQPPSDPVPQPEQPGQPGQPEQSLLAEQPGQPVLLTKQQNKEPSEGATALGGAAPAEEARKQKNNVEGRLVSESSAVTVSDLSMMPSEELGRLSSLSVSNTGASQTRQSLDDLRSDSFEHARANGMVYGTETEFDEKSIQGTVPEEEDGEGFSVHWAVNQTACVPMDTPAKDAGSMVSPEHAPELNAEAESAASSVPAVPEGSTVTQAAAGVHAKPGGGADAGAGEAAADVHAKPGACVHAGAVEESGAAAVPRSDQISDHMQGGADEGAQIQASQLGSAGVAMLAEKQKDELDDEIMPNQVEAAPVELSQPQAVHPEAAKEVNKGEQTQVEADPAELSQPQAANPDAAKQANNNNEVEQTQTEAALDTSTELSQSQVATTDGDRDTDKVVLTQAEADPAEPSQPRPVHQDEAIAEELHAIGQAETDASEYANGLAQSSNADPNAAEDVDAAAIHINAEDAEAAVCLYDGHDADATTISDLAQDAGAASFPTNAKDADAATCGCDESLHEVRFEGSVSVDAKPAEHEVGKEELGADIPTSKLGACSASAEGPLEAECPDGAENADKVVRSQAEATPAELSQPVAASSDGVPTEVTASGHMSNTGTRDDADVSGNDTDDRPHEPVADVHTYGAGSKAEAEAEAKDLTSEAEAKDLAAVAEAEVEAVVEAEAVAEAETEDKDKDKSLSAVAEAEAEDLVADSMHAGAAKESKATLIWFDDSCVGHALQPPEAAGIAAAVAELAAEPAVEPAAELQRNEGTYDAALLNDDSDDDDDDGHELAGCRASGRLSDEAVGWRGTAERAILDECEIEALLEDVVRGEVQEACMSVGWDTVDEAESLTPSGNRGLVQQQSFTKLALGAQIMESNSKILFLEGLVQRLSKELARAGPPPRKDTGQTMVEQLEMHDEGSQFPCWLAEQLYLSPLLVAYDERISILEGDLQMKMEDLERMNQQVLAVESVHKQSVMELNAKVEETAAALELKDKEYQLMYQAKEQLMEQQVSMETELRSMHAQVDAREAQSLASIQENATIIAAAHQSNMRVQEMEARQLRAQEAMKKAEERVLSLEQQLSETIAIMEDERMDADATLRALEEFKHQNRVLNEELSNSETRCQAAHGTCSTLQVELGATKERCEQSNMKCAALADEVKHLSSALQDVEAKLLTYQNKNIEVYGRIKEVLYGADEARAARDAAFARCAELQEEVSDLKLKCSVAEEEKVAMCNDKAVAMREVEEHEIKIAELQSASHTLAANNQSLAAQLASLKVDLGEALSSKSRISLMSLSALEKIQDVERERDESSLKMEGMARRLENCTTEWQLERKNFEINISRLKKRYAEFEAQAALSSSEAARAVHQMNDLSVKLQDCEARNADLEEKLRMEVSAVKAACEHEVSLLSAQVEASMANSARSVADAERMLEAKEALLLRWKSEAQLVAGKLEQALEEHRSEFEQKAYELVVLKQQVEEHRSELEQRAYELVVLRQQVEEHRGQFEQKAHEVVVLKQQIEEYKNESGQKAHEVVVLKQQVEEYKNESGQKAHEVVVLKQQVEEYKNECGQKAQEVVVLKQQLEDLQCENMFLSAKEAETIVEEAKPQVHMNVLAGWPLEEYNSHQKEEAEVQKILLGVTPVKPGRARLAQTSGGAASTRDPTHAKFDAIKRGVHMRVIP